MNTTPTPQATTPAKVVTIKRVTTGEANVSERHVSFDVYVNGEYLTSRDDVCDALDLKASLENAA